MILNTMQVGEKVKTFFRKAEFNLKNWGMIMSSKKFFVYGVVYPIAFLWDLVYYIITGIYNVATWVDENGGEYLESKLK